MSPPVTPGQLTSAIPGILRASRYDTRLEAAQWDGNCPDAVILLGQCLAQYE